MAIDTHVEPEINYVVGRAFDLPDLRGVVGRSVREAEQAFRTAYFDTPDLRLWSRGITLTRRNGPTDGHGTWTLTFPGADDASALNRRVPGSDDEVPPEARALLRGIIRRAALDEVVALETVRLPWTLHDRTGDQWAELDYDDVTVAGGPQDGLRYRQVTIDRIRESSDEQELPAVLKALRRAGAKPDDRPKPAKVLGVPVERSQRRSAKAARTSTAADIVRQAIFDALQRLLDHDYRLRLRPEDPDGHDIHQARVATRRLRSHVKTLRPLLDPIWRSHTENELRWLGKVLGAVRDVDVMETSITSAGHAISQLPGSASQALDTLEAKLAAERDHAVADLGEALGSERYLDLLDRLHAAAFHPPLTRGSDNEPKPLRASDVMTKLVGRRWRNIEKKVATAGGSPSDEELHRIRIAAKNLRYACELSRPVIGKEAAKTAGLAEDIQTVLGEYHDASASIDWLAQAGTTGSTRSGFAAGVLAAAQDHRRRKLAKKWRRRWRALSRPSGHRWLA